jgi:hypothetical protein
MKLNNNNMATEIFIEPELMELEQPEVAQEWFNICSELGLDKQLAHADKSEDKKAPPYMYVDPKTSRIIKTLCPVQVDYHNYKTSTIPLDILKEIQKAEVNGWYKKIHICYDDKSPDPFVVGFTKSDSDWSADVHLIARWGAELLPFEILEQKAMARVKQNAIDALKELQFKVNSALENVDAFTNGLITGKAVPTLNFGIEDIRKW